MQLRKGWGKEGGGSERESGETGVPLRGFRPPPSCHSPLLSKQQRADGQQAVKPAAGLVEGLADEVGGKLVAELLGRAGLVRIAPLGERHGPGVEPAVDHFRNPPHPRAGGLGRVVGHRVDVRLVDAQIVGQSRVLLLRLLPDLGAGHARLGQQLGVAADGLRVAGLFADPDRQRRAPVALAREGPIDVRLQEIAKPPVADVLRQPVDAAVVGQHLLLEGRGADEPALARILDQRVFFGPPTERIVVNVLLLVEQLAFGLHLADDVAVAVLDPAALVFGRFGGERAVGGDRADQRAGLRRRRIGHCSVWSKSKSTSPNAGAWWTMPVPVSTVTKSAGTTRQARCLAGRPCFQPALLSRLLVV